MTLFFRLYFALAHIFISGHSNLRLQDETSRRTVRTRSVLLFLLIMTTMVEPCKGQVIEHVQSFVVRRADDFGTAG